MAERNIHKKWKILVIELRDKRGKKFKVTRRLPEMFVAETKMFRSKKKAKQQWEEWLQ